VNGHYSKSCKYGTSFLRGVKSSELRVVQCMCELYPANLHRVVSAALRPPSDWRRPVHGASKKLLAEVSPGGRPSPCRLRCTETAIWLEETRGASKKLLAENDRWRCSVPELWSPYGVEEGKGQGGLATSHQYGNALLGVCYQEEAWTLKSGKAVKRWEVENAKKTSLAKWLLLFSCTSTSFICKKMNYFCTKYDS